MLSEKTRSSFFQNLSPIVGEEAISEMLAQYPTTEGERPVTKDYLDARLSQLRVELGELRVELHKGINRMLLLWIPVAVAAISSTIAAVGRLGA